MLISLAMIVKNEEETLAHCLESVKPIVEEMIIVDTGSTDSTIEIAKSFGASVYNFQWCDDFSAARNESLKHCTGEWVLIMDADEAIDPLDHEKIKNACTSPFADAYELTNRDYMLSSLASTHDSAAVPNRSAYAEGRNLPFYAEAMSLRLAKRFDWLSFEGRIHETIGNSLEAHGKSVKRLNAVIHHYGQLLTERKGYKSNYYLTLAQLDAEADPENLAAQFHVLQQALVAGQWELALQAAEASINSSEKVHPFVIFGAGAALQELGRHEEAIAHFDALLAAAPGHTLAKLRKGASFEALGNFNVGRQLMEEALEAEPGNVQVYGSLANLELALNNPDGARQVLLKGVETIPREPLLYDLLIKIEIERGNQPQAAQDALRGIQNCPSGNTMWYRLAAAHLSSIGERQTAKSILELGLKTFPGDQDLERLAGII
ncbi:MAG: glycosyltransferase [Holophagales bacterium]|jgi:tetratricopeptide (TPR) repeat protein|nr:glycosyltransferase [Holophagales bacterium]